MIPVMAKALHWWRLLVEPGPSRAGQQPGRWQVEFNDGGCSMPMPYAAAHSYAEMFGAKVRRCKGIP